MNEALRGHARTDGSAGGWTARIDGRGAAALLMLAAAFAIRGWEFGNPFIHVDENFYLLVGDRMLHGALPYVDIWDRKPIGLFLLYAGIRLLGGNGIIEYQVVATLFAGATAFLVARMARRMAGPAASLGAGLLYLLLLGVASGLGGQSPVFYNLLTAIAARLTLEAYERADLTPRALRWIGCATMAALGIALQIKYNVLFEGIFFGLLLMHRASRLDQPRAMILLDALLWIGIAIAPTLAAVVYYAWSGALDAYVYANFLSVGARSSDGGRYLERRLVHAWLAVHLPIIAVLLAYLLEPWRAYVRGPATFHFVLAWLGAALFGYAVFGTYFDHYALPVMLPLSIAASSLLSCGYKRIGICATIVLLGAGMIANVNATINNLHNGGGMRAMNRMVSAITSNLRGGSLYVFDGDPLLYHLSGARIPTRFAFPDALLLSREAGAIGIDPLDEIRRILATRPTVIVDTIVTGNPHGPAPHEDFQKSDTAKRLVRATLRTDYHLAAAVQQHYSVVAIYALNGGS